MKQAKVLIVDDDIQLSEEIAEVLKEHGFSVAFARTLFQFEQRTRDEQFDLFVVDLLLPDGHGHEIIRDIRRTCMAGIVVLSGKLTEVDKVVSFELGADDYVVKPFARFEFVARIKSLLRRMEARNAPEEPGGPEAVEISFGCLQTDLMARKVYGELGEQIELTKLEFDLWEVLLKNLDRVQSREQIINAIRGCNWAGYDRSIDGLVSRLRKKFSNYAIFDDNFETIRGVGYMLRKPNL